MQQQAFPSAAAYASTPNFGVKGFRGLQQQQPPSISEESKPTSTAPSAPLESEDELLQRRYDNWSKMRLTQKRAIERQIDLKDVASFLLVLAVLQRAVHFAGLKLRVVAPLLALFGLLNTVWQNRVRERRLPNQPSSVYTCWPVFGHIGIIGDAIKLGGSTLQRRMAKLNNYATREVAMFGKPNQLSLMDPADRRYMLRTNWKNFAKNLDDGSGFQEKFAEIMGRGIFAVDGEEWADQRKVASHMFSANGLKLKMERSFTEHGNKMVALLKQRKDPASTLNFQDVMANLTFETICDIAFGVSPGSLEAGFNGSKIDFLLQFDRAQQDSANRFIFPAPVWKLMRYFNVGSERRLREDSSALRQYVGDIVRNHKEEDDDLLSLYIRTGKETGKQFMLEEDYLVDTVLNFMIAGRDTTSCLLTNMFKLMTPEVERRMLEELDRVVGRSNNVGWDHMRDLRYCSAVFNEVLRLYPPVGFDTRSVVADCEFPSGLKVKAGDAVALPLIAIGRDPNLFDRPDEFLPERWIVDDHSPVGRPDEYVYPVFLGGARLCLGKDSSRLQATCVAYKLLANFNFVVCPHSEKMVNGPVQFYEDGLPVKITARQ